jgi:hypothetical protein
MPVSIEKGSSCEPQLVVVAAAQRARLMHPLTCFEQLLAQLATVACLVPQVTTPQ